MKTWIKLYTEIVDDPKIGRLSLADAGLWTMLMALAGKLDHRDDQGNATGQLDTLENVAWHLRHSAQEITPGIDRLIAAGMLHISPPCTGGTQGGDGIITVTHFAERQERPSETAAAVAQRVKRHRARTRQKKTQTVTTGNDAVPGSVGGDVTTGHDEETPLESDSDSEQDTDAESEPDSDQEQTTPPTHPTADAAATRTTTGKRPHGATAAAARTDAQLLQSIGITEPTLSKILARKLPTGCIAAWIDYANSQNHLKNRQGFLVTMLTMPNVRQPPDHDATTPKQHTWYTEEEYQRFFVQPDQQEPTT